MVPLQRRTSLISATALRSRHAGHNWRYSADNLIFQTLLPLYFCRVHSVEGKTMTLRSRWQKTDSVSRTVVMIGWLLTCAFALLLLGGVFFEIVFAPRPFEVFKAKALETAEFGGLVLVIAAAWWLALEDRFTWIRATVHGLIWGGAAGSSWLVVEEALQKDVSLWLSVALVVVAVAYRSPRVFLVSMIALIGTRASLGMLIALYRFFSGYHLPS
jgi:hypothetical protein